MFDSYKKTKAKHLKEDNDLSLQMLTNVIRT